MMSLLPIKKTSLLCPWIRSYLFLFGLSIATIIHATLGLFTFPLPFIYRYRFITLWSRFVIFWLKITCHINYRLEGFENLPTNTPVIILSKHQSTWETLAFQVFFSPQTWVMKKELLNIPFFGWALRLLEPIAIDRRKKLSSIEQIIKQGREKLQAGRWVIIFPEGTRTAFTENRPFLAGGARLAEATGFPVIPVTHNAGLFWPKKGFLKKAGTVIVRIGPIIDTKNKKAEEINAIAKAWIDQTTPQLL